MKGRMTVLLYIVVPFLTISALSADELAILQPGRKQNESGHELLTWRTRPAPTVHFWDGCVRPEDTVAVWFKPLAPCSLIAIRFYPYSMEGTCLVNVWDGSHYDGRITTTDSTDSNGWIGDVEDGQWIPGPVMKRSPIGWNEDDSAHHYWGMFPFTVHGGNTGQWIEIPTTYGLQGDVDLGHNPFLISITFYQTGGGGWAGEDEARTPYHSFRYYSHVYGWEEPGPDGQHFGWFIHRVSVWIEAIVRYYEPFPGPYMAYFDHRIDDDETGQSHGDGNGLINPGETIEISIRLVNIGDALAADLVGTLRTMDLYAAVIDSLEIFGDTPPQDTVASAGNFVFAVSSDCPNAHSIDFSLEVREREANIQYLFFSLAVTHLSDEEILIVKDNGGAAGSRYTDALSGLGVSYDLWSVSDSGTVPPDVLLRHRTVIWFTGVEGRNTLSPADRDNLHMWLSAGGNLFLTGQLIGADIGDTPFYSDYLRSKHVGTPTHLSHLKAVPGNPVVGDVDISLSVAGACQQSFASEINPFLPAFSIFTYDTTTDEGPGNIQSTGSAAVAVETRRYKVVYFAFGFEGIESSADRLIVMDRILNWFGYQTTGVGENDCSILIPERIMLFQNYPNPFNSTTVIPYTVPSTGTEVNSEICAHPTTLTIYNILGQEVRALADGPQAPGQYTIIWDGRDNRGLELSSGVYFYRLTAGRTSQENPGCFSETGRMVLLK